MHIYIYIQYSTFRSRLDELEMNLRLETNLRRTNLAPSPRALPGGGGGAAVLTAGQPTGRRPRHKRRAAPKRQRPTVPTPCNLRQRVQRFI